MSLYRITIRDRRTEEDLMDLTFDVDAILPCEALEFAGYGLADDWYRDGPRSLISDRWTAEVVPCLIPGKNHATFR